MRPTDTTGVPAQACDAGVVDAVDEVEVRRYPGMAHTINEEELGVCRELVRRVAGVQGATRP
ncbi:MAG: hypothetical protein NTZ09_10640 [Candidatus Hydrogenedentes bacterium]|nr:hypothetical protein [Candidatus Hydrogenedentota bacterium]